MAISNYRVIKQATLESLAIEVNKAIDDDGLQPIGNFFIQPDSGLPVYFQAVATVSSDANAAHGAEVPIYTYSGGDSTKVGTLTVEDGVITRFNLPTGTAIVGDGQQWSGEEVAGVYATTVTASIHSGIVDFIELT